MTDTATLSGSSAGATGAITISVYSGSDASACVAGNLVQSKTATPATNGDGGYTATFSGLAAGNYTVEVTWPPFFNQASNAPFAIYDGSSLLTTVLVDETAAPAGVAYGGATFKLIGTVNISSGTLKVVLSNTGTNHTWIIANAVRVAPV